jgi:hypothetical protein
MLALEIQVQRCPLAQPRRDLPPVYLDHFAGSIEHRHDYRAVEVLVAGLSQDAQPLQPSAHLRAGDAVLSFKSITQRPVGEAKPETVDDLRRLEAARGQIPQRLRRLFQRLVVVAHHLQQQRPVVRLPRHRRRQLRNRALLHRLDWRSRRGKMVGSKQLHRMAETHTLGPHHPLDHVAARVAGAQAVPEIFSRSDNQRRRPVVMEGALAQKVGSVPRQLHAPRLGQPLHRDFFL